MPALAILAAWFTPAALGEGCSALLRHNRANKLTNRFMLQSVLSRAPLPEKMTLTSSAAIKTTPVINSLR